MSKGKKGSIVRMSLDGSANVIPFQFNPERLSTAKSTTWNKIKAPGGYFPQGQFQFIDRVIKLKLQYHYSKKTKEQNEADNGLWREYSILDSLTEPDVMDSEFAGKLSAGELLRGTAPPRTFLDYGLNRPNTSAPIPALEVLINGCVLDIELMNRTKGWLLVFSATFDMELALVDKDAIGYYNQIKSALGG